MYLLDSDVIIQALNNRQPAPRILERLAGSRIYISTITLGEIYERAFGLVNPDAHLISFRQVLSPHHTLTLTDPITPRFAKGRSSSRRRGQLGQRSKQGSLVHRTARGAGEGWPSLEMLPKGAGPDLAQ